MYFSQTKKKKIYYVQTTDVKHISNNIITNKKNYIFSC